MKKTIPILMIIILITSGFGANALNISDQPITQNQLNQKIQTHIQTPQLTVQNYNQQYIDITLEQTTTYLQTPQKPLLPKIVKTIELPFGVTNIHIQAKTGTITNYQLTKQIRPASIHIPLTSDTNQITISNIDLKDKQTYQSNEPYPNTWYKYNIGCGLNQNMQRVTFVVIHHYPIQYTPQQNKIQVCEDITFDITYEEPRRNLTPTNEEYDLLIIAPLQFHLYLRRLVRHKNNMGLQTKLVSTSKIYRTTEGVDKPEKIKKYIWSEIENSSITYVLLVGGLKNQFWARPRDDHSQGSKGWYVPVRYNNLYDDPEHPLAESSIYDPGVITDLYYADIYEEDGKFSSWDPNGDGIFAAMSKPNVENDTGIDMFPDIAVGRLACRNRLEVIIMVNKIIKYEKKPADRTWFEKIISISGDGFLDQQDLDFQWNISELPNGEYTIYAQSKNPDGNIGPLDIINVTIDMTQESNITFNHDDHLKVDKYPFPPIAEITSPSEGNILGNTDYFREPTEGEAYGNMFLGWANISFENNTMHIRGKSYDPQPYGNLTDVHVWITNSNNDIVYNEWRNNTEMYYEGEWVAGNKKLMGKGGALYYLPDYFEKDLVWASNGKLTGQPDVIEKLTEGAGFAFLSGHGSPRVWADHYPGVPGNRRYGSVTGLLTIDRRGPPFFPMFHIKNYDKPFILVVGGCHNAQFNVSYIPSKLDGLLHLYMWTYGSPAPECFNWWLTRLPRRGAIASLGNTGLGYGTLGKECTVGGLDGGICLEFFRQYSEMGHEILGTAYCQTQTYYAQTFDMEEDDHIKSLQQWVLLGDPSLMIGGYS